MNRRASLKACRDLLEKAGVKNDDPNPNITEFFSLYNKIDDIF